MVGEILHGAVKRPLAEYLSERIWAKFGMESDATWWLASADGMEIAGSGLSATLRDLGPRAGKSSTTWISSRRWSRRFTSDSLS